VGAPVPPVSDRASDPLERRGTEGPGAKPGLSSLDALRAARRTLAEAEARLAAIAAEQHVLQREAVTWVETADRLRGLIQYYESRLHEPSPDEAGGADGTPPVAEETRKTDRGGSIERFGKIVIPVANALIAARGGRPVPVDEIYRALAPDLRRDLDAVSSVYSTPFRIRRMFRRHQDYVVTDDGITFAGEAVARTAPAAVTLSRIVRRDDGGISAMTVVDDSETASDVKPAQLRAALRSGQTVMLPERNGRRSELRLAGGRFYSQAQGIENDDFLTLPDVFERDLPA
jgi:hypothetical protein